MTKYLNDVPKPLQEDFVENNVLPFVGAGFLLKRYSYFLYSSNKDNKDFIVVRKSLSSYIQLLNLSNDKRGSQGS